MKFIAKIAILIVGIFVLVGVKSVFFDKPTILPEPPNEKITIEKIEKERPNEAEATKIPSLTKEAIKPVMYLYYVYSKEGVEPTLKKVLRDYDDNDNKLHAAITELLKGPSAKEKRNGFSTEIPVGTTLLGIRFNDNAILLNLSGNFQYGGGTESLYKRIQQLVRTVLTLNLEKPVYLYLDGKKVETIGGEGIIINQPLSESTLNE